jgi:hypothetical protein
MRAFSATALLFTVGTMIASAKEYEPLRVEDFVEANFTQQIDHFTGFPGTY